VSRRNTASLLDVVPNHRPLSSLKARIPPFTAFTRAKLSFAHQNAKRSEDGREADMSVLFPPTMA